MCEYIKPAVSGPAATNPGFLGLERRASKLAGIGTNINGATVDVLAFGF